MVISIILLSSVFYLISCAIENNIFQETHNIISRFTNTTCLYLGLLILGAIWITKLFINTFDLIGLSSNHNAYSDNLSQVLETGFNVFLVIGGLLVIVSFLVKAIEKHLSS